MKLFSVFGDMNASINPLNGITCALTDFSKSISRVVSELNESVLLIGEVLVEVFEPFMVAEKLGETQYVYWDYPDSDFCDLVLSTKNINKLLREYNEDDKYRTVDRVVKLCGNYILLNPYKKIYTQSIQAYCEKKNELAVVGFLTIIDGLLTDSSGDNTTRIDRRAKAIMGRVENNESLTADEIELIMLLLTIQKTVEALSSHSVFSEKEPKNLNRHWIMHGRSRRRKTKLDCVKLIYLIYGILLINDYAEADV